MLHVIALLELPIRMVELAPATSGQVKIVNLTFEQVTCLCCG